MMLFLYIHKLAETVREGTSVSRRYRKIGTLGFETGEFHSAREVQRRFNKLGEEYKVTAVLRISFRGQHLNIRLDEGYKTLFKDDINEIHSDLEEAEKAAEGWFNPPAKLGDILHSDDD